MRRVVFHIGIPKTGSTALQVFLAKNADVLRSHSVDYLEIGEYRLGKAGRISSGNGAYLARNLLPKHSAAYLPNTSLGTDRFLESVTNSDASISIVSSELFVDAESSLFSNLLDTLRQNSIIPQVFYFVRDQVQFLSSSYVQQIKRHGLTSNPNEYVKQGYQNIPYLRYASWHAKMQELFGNNAIICRTYEGAIRNTHGIFGTTCEALGFPQTNLVFDISDVNTGMSLEELKILRLINNYRPRMQFSDYVVENSQMAGRARSGDVYNLLSSDVVDLVERFYLQENTDFAKSYFHRPNLFPEDFRPPHSRHYDESSIGIPDIIEFFGGLTCRFDERLATLQGRIDHLERLTKSKPMAE